MCAQSTPSHLPVGSKFDLAYAGDSEMCDAMLTGAHVNKAIEMCIVASVTAPQPFVCLSAYVYVKHSAFTGMHI